MYFIYQFQLKSCATYFKLEMYVKWWFTTSQSCCFHSKYIKIVSWGSILLVVKGLKKILEKKRKAHQEGFEFISACLIGPYIDFDYNLQYINRVWVIFLFIAYNNVIFAYLHVPYTREDKISLISISVCWVTLVDVFFFSFHGKTSAQFMIALFSLFYTWVGWL